MSFRCDVSFVLPHYLECDAAKPTTGCRADPTADGSLAASRLRVMAKLEGLMPNAAILRRFGAEVSCLKIKIELLDYTLSQSSASAWLMQECMHVPVLIICAPSPNISVLHAQDSRQCTMGLCRYLRVLRMIISFTATRKSSVSQDHDKQHCNSGIVE